MSNLVLKFSQRNKLKPLNELDANDLTYLYSEAEITQMQPRTLISAEHELLTYLLEGEVSLLSEIGRASCRERV